MAAPFHNQRYNIAYKYTRNKQYDVHRAAWNDEDLTGKTNKLGFVLQLQMALDYCLIIYTDITLPDREVGAETWEEVRARFGWVTNKKYFVKAGINLSKIGDFFDLEALSALNVDTQVLIDAQPDNDTPTYP